MDEYIKREAALEESVELYHWCGYEDRYGDFVPVDAIQRIPAADVAPVRHARWVDNHCTACGMMPMGDEMWKHCDFEPPRFELFMDYCPNCGCRMDG